VLAIDLSGESLHRRGYREEGAMAPLKENLAAAVLVRAGWPAIAAAGGPLLDPMCGSGTLLIEGAWIAGDRAPGLGRDYFGFPAGAGTSRRCGASWWPRRAPARPRGREDPRHPRLRYVEPGDRGGDRQHRAGGAARVVHVERFAIGEHLLAPDAKDRSPGLVVCNPPYGARVGEGEDLRPLYRSSASC
jgi:23S rRNA (guanine2445-N2)-methyltransferase / 23S rRNA (guanine2069-N7)-methyltransferase